jgi:acetyl-CoA carboxylase biotin carboxyl carrier protein
LSLAIIDLQARRVKTVRFGSRARFGARLYAAPTSAPSRRSWQLPDVDAHITGTVWKIEVEVGDTVEEGDAVVILESMKMEMPVEAEDPGVVKEICCSEGQSVSEGDTLVVLE